MQTQEISHGMTINEFARIAYLGQMAYRSPHFISDVTNTANSIFAK